MIGVLSGGTAAAQVRAGAPLRDAVVQDATAVSVTITAVTPQILKPGDDLTITATATNTSTQTIEQPRAAVLLSRTSLSTRYSLDAWASADPTASAGTIGHWALYVGLDGIVEVALAVGLAVVYHQYGLLFKTWSFNTVRARSLLKQSWPLIISAVMVSIYMKIDAVMLKSQGSVEVGIYSAAARLSESWYFIPIAIVTSVFPAIVQLRKNDPEKFERRMQNLYDLLVVISLPTAVVISFTADDVIRMIYGSRFPGAGAMLSIHIWSGVIVFLGTASGQYMLVEGLNRLTFWRTGIGALVNIAINLWLIPRYGGVGASIAGFFNGPAGVAG